MNTLKTFDITTKQACYLLGLDLGEVTDYQSDSFSLFLNKSFPGTHDLDILKNMLYSWWLRIWTNREKDLLLNTSSFKAKVELNTHHKRWNYYTEWHNPTYIGLLPPAVEMEPYHSMQRELKSLKYQLNLYTNGK